MMSDPVESSSEDKAGSCLGHSGGTPSWVWIFSLVNWAFWLIGIFAVLILFVLPALIDWSLGNRAVPKSMTRYFDLLRSAQIWLMCFLGPAWIFFLGSCFASFLNVVAWRVPRGGSINGSSHCPDCDQRLKFRDNMPVIGWLRIGGRCSNCGLPIPIRYLLVELLLGALFVLVFWVQVLGGGGNLPFRDIEKVIGFENLILFPNLNLILLTIYHLILICLLFTFTLIKNETLKIPLRVWWVGLILGFAVPLIWPVAHLVSWKLGQVDVAVFERGSLDQLMTLGLGPLIGIALGLILKRFLRTSEPEHPYVFQPTYIGEEVAGLSLVGLFLGWQSAVSVFLLAAFLFLLFRVCRLKWNFTGLTGCLLVATLLHLLCWRISTNCPYWPSGSWLSFP